MLYCLIHVHYVHLIFHGAPHTLMRVCAHTFLVILHLHGSHNIQQQKNACTDARQRVGSAMKIEVDIVNMD